MESHKRDAIMIKCKISFKNKQLAHAENAIAALAKHSTIPRAFAFSAQVTHSRSLHRSLIPLLCSDE